ncbi:MAG: hypothetical protein QXS95_02670 [Candidatus Nitrosocaldus sp.]
MQSKSNDVSGWVEDLMRMLHMLEGDDVHSIYNLNAIASRTAELYMDFSRVYRAKSKRVIAYTALYVALRLEGHALTVNAFARRVGIDARSLAVCYRAMQRVLGLTIPKVALHAYINEIVRCIGKGIQDMYKGVDATVLKDAAYRLADDVDRMMNGKGVNPAGVAAAIVYLALGDDMRRMVSMKYLAATAGISMVTLKKRVEELRVLLNRDVNAITHT